MKKGNVVIGALAGLAVGAVAGVLLAPEKGSTTRKQILGKARGYKDEIKSKFDELSNTVTEKFKSTKNDAEDLLDKGKAKFGDEKKDQKNASTNFKYDEMNHAGS